MKFMDTENLSLIEHPAVVMVNKTDFTVACSATQSGKG